MTETVLPRADVGVVDRGEALQVKLASGELSSASWENILNGANRIAIGYGHGGPWEIIQFEKAELITDRTYLLSNRLRGQFGTDVDMPETWSTGAYVVLLNEAVSQIDLSPADRNIAKQYRIGPAAQSLDGPAYVEIGQAFPGVGLRPYAPCHLSVRRTGGTDEITWIRRTRISGDGWDGQSVPLGEESELYSIRVYHDGSIVREEETSTALWVYSDAAKSVDGVSGEYTVKVAQISSIFGAGGYSSLTVA